jgi:hypothetical protein
LELPEVNKSEIAQEVIKLMMFNPVVVKCPACAQWGAVKTECKHCGHPVDPE